MCVSSDVCILPAAVAPPAAGKNPCPARRWPRLLAASMTAGPTLDLADLRVCLGRSDRPGLAVACPVLEGDAIESLFPEVAPRRLTGRGTFELFAAGDWLVGRAAVPVAAGLEEATRRLYRELLQVVGAHALVRVWNYVPAINATSAAGPENYHAFCRGRSLAFEEHFGASFPVHAPAASAVGAGGASLAVVFAAHAGAPSHVENPRQVPAYDYPPEHGPRAPTFARASVVNLAGGARAAFISGTSAIRGHASVAPGATLPQLECTLENLREIGAACGLGRDLAAGRAAARHFKVYLRHAADLHAVRARLESTVLRPGDRIVTLRSDICRRELNVEIEVTLPDVSCR